MANLRLDTKDGVLAKVIVAGDSAHSKLFQRVSQDKKALRMPPPASGLSLSAQEIDLFKRWIDDGAKWELHWAYEVPNRPEPPAMQSAKWAHNDIDKFVLARLEQSGLKPSPEADRITLLRRVTFDLTGLPPSPAEVDDFLRDRSADAYEKVVDRLLASPQYGERMTMQWLDLARYSDTHGYHIDSHRDMWPWRDWVIKAFNSNMPFDRFTMEQLAGDLLPNATRDQKIATGFNRNHMINFEGGAIPEEYLNEYLVDRVDTTSTVWLGSTMGCSRCHDHKYDPFKQKDYYSFYAFFNSVPEKGLDGRAGNADPIMALPTDAQQQRLDELKAGIKTEEKTLAEEVLQPLVAKWEEGRLDKFAPEPRSGLAAYYALDGSYADLSGHFRDGRTVAGETFYGPGPIGQSAELKGETQVEFGKLNIPTQFTLAFWTKSAGLQDMPLLRLNGNSLDAGESIPLGGLTRGAYLFWSAADGKRYRTQDRVFGATWIHIAIQSGADGPQAWINGKPQRMTPVESASPAQGTGLTIPTGFKGSYDDVRIYDRALTKEEIDSLATQQPIRSILFEQAKKRSKQQQEALREYFLTNDAPEPYRSAHQRLLAEKKELAELNKIIPTVMVMKELDKPRETHILGRGDYRNLGDKVSPAVPAFLPQLAKGAAPNRLTLAKWIVDPANPLTARVAVNRYWAMYFGTGLVKTVEDFGSQGEAPSHPELLDWLATEFVRTNWDVKGMQRLIVTSAVYRQASRSTPELNEKDPENRLLSRGPRFRLPAEMIRDSALSAGGLLDAKIGGPSVYPYTPKGVWEDIAYGDVFSAQLYPTNTTAADHYRRSMYSFWKRTAPPPDLNTFDAPDREKCTARRPLTNTPLQALVLLNDPTFVEAARMLAQRMLLEGGPDPLKRIQYGFRLVTARQPSPKELAILRDLAKQQTTEYDRNPQNAAKLLTVGDAAPDPKADKVLLAAWTTVASTILNLDEAITKE